MGAEKSRFVFSAIGMSVIVIIVVAVVVLVWDSGDEGVADLSEGDDLPIGDGSIAAAPEAASVFPAARQMSSARGPTSETMIWREAARGDLYLSTPTDA